MPARDNLQVPAFITKDEKIKVTYLAVRQVIDLSRTDPYH